MLKIQVKSGTFKEPIWIVDPILSIGKNSANDLVVNSKDIKDFHAQIILKNNKVYLKDITGKNGCFVNEEQIKEKELKAGDQIKLNDVEMDVLDGKQISPTATVANSSSNQVWSLVSNNSWLEGQSFEITDTTIIGRGVNCQITIPGTHLSRQHCELRVRDTRLHVEDLGSSNGTFLNEKKITKAEAKPGDTLRVDVYSFEIVGPEDDDSDKTMIRTIASGDLDADNQSNKQAHRKTTANSANKKYKTKSTSPGNREEEAGANTSSNLFVYGFLVVAVVAVVALMLLS